MVVTIPVGIFWGLLFQLFGVRKVHRRSEVLIDSIQGAFRNSSF